MGSATEQAENKAEWTTAYINDLPDSAFAYIESGGEKDGEGKTTPRSKRHFPHHNAEGGVDLPHLRNALARAPQSSFGDRALPHLKRHASSAGVGKEDDGMLEYKTWAGELKAITTGNGGFEGYGSLLGIRDEGGDIVDPGAYLRTLEYFKHHGFIADGHNWNSVSMGAIGTVVDAIEDSQGLFIRTEYHSTPHAQAARTVALERLARGKSVGLSIGYGVAPDGFYYGDDGARHLTDVKVYEVSQVNVPMLREAGLTAVKGFGLSFEDHSDNVRVAVTEWLERARSGLDVRLKDGRKITEARRQRMAVVKDSLLANAAEVDALLLETEPKAKEPAADDQPKTISADLAALKARFLELAAMHPVEITL